MLSRIIWGARISVTVGFGAVAISTRAGGHDRGRSPATSAAGRPAGPAAGGHLDLVPGPGAADQPGGRGGARPLERDRSSWASCWRPAPRGSSGAPSSASATCRTSSRRSCIGAGHTRVILQVRPAERLRADHRPGDGPARHGDPGRVDLQLPGLRGPAAVPGLGRYAERHGPGVHAPIAVALDLAGAGDQPGGLRLQHARATPCATSSTPGCAAAGEQSPSP